MKKHLAMLGVLLFLAVPVRANHEAEITHRLCDAVRDNDSAMRQRYGDSLEVVLAICDYVDQLENRAANCGKLRASLSLTQLRLNPAEDSKTMMVFRYYPITRVSVLEPMTPIGLEVRQDKGMRPESGEVLNCGYRNETFPIGDVPATRIRHICGQYEFIVIGHVYGFPR